MTDHEVKKLCDALDPVATTLRILVVNLTGWGQESNERVGERSLAEIGALLLKCTELKSLNLCLGK